MKLTGNVKDAAGNGIPSASVLVATVSGTPTGVGTQTDENGAYSFYADVDEADTYLLISSIGYESGLTKYVSGGTTSLGQKSTELEEVVFTAKRTPKAIVSIKKPNYIVPICLGSAGTIMLGFWIKFHFFA